MQACPTAALCKRLSLFIAILAAFGGLLLAQTDQIPANTEAVTPPAAAPAATAAPALTQAAATPTAPPASADASASASNAGWTELALPVIKTIGGIGMVISLILIGFMLFRKFAPQYARKNASERTLRLLETLPMGDKRSILLVQAGARKLLLASTPGQIALLTLLAETPGTASLNTGTPAEDVTPAAAAGNFRSLYESEKKALAARPAGRPALSADIRGKMQELRKALEG